MKKHFNMVYFDFYLKKRLIRLAIKENIINRYIEPSFENGSFNIKDDPLRVNDVMELQQNQYKSELLLYLSIFETFDSTMDFFDFSWFKNEGLLSSESVLINDKYGKKHFDKQEQIILNNRNEFFLYFRLNKKIIFNSCMAYVDNAFLEGSKYKQLNRKSIIDNEYLLKYYDNLIIHFENSDEIEEEFHAFWFKLSIAKVPSNNDYVKAYLSNFGERFLDILYDYFDLFTLSQNNNKMFVSPILNCCNNKNTGIIDINKYYILLYNLNINNIVLPAPISIKEAVRINKSKQMRDFRETLSAWYQMINDGDLLFAKKIEKDIKKASIEFKAYEHWNEFKESPFNFFINSIGGHIPLLSNIITVFNTVGDLATKIIKKNKSWIFCTFGKKKW